MKKIALVVLFAFLTGCAGPGARLKKLREGMNQSEVEHVMGEANDIKEPAENSQGRMVNIWVYNLGGQEYQLFWVQDRLAAWAEAAKWTPDDMRNLQLDVSVNDETRAYIRKLPGVNSIPPQAGLPLDGQWKRRDYDVKLNQGVGEMVFSSDNPFNGKPFFKSIVRLAPGKYKCENLAWSDAKRETWYGVCEITVKSPTQIAIEYKPDATRGEDSGFIEYFDLVNPANPVKFEEEVKAAGL